MSVVNIFDTAFFSVVPCKMFSHSFPVFLEKLYFCVMGSEASVVVFYFLSV